MAVSLDIALGTGNGENRTYCSLAAVMESLWTEEGTSSLRVGPELAQQLPCQFSGWDLRHIITPLLQPHLEMEDKSCLLGMRIELTVSVNSSPLGVFSPVHV